MPIDTKKLGNALLQELQRRSTQKSADRGVLLEQIGDGTGAHLFVGEKNGEVSLLVPVEDGYEGPSKIEIAVGGNEAKKLQVATREGVVEIEGVKFNRFVLEPLRWGADLVGERPEIALRGDGPDGQWSPLGFDDWFFADYATVKWLALSDALVVAPEVRADAKDPSWKTLDDKQRAALEKLLERPLPKVVHQSVLDEALHKAKDDDGLIMGALQGLSLSLDNEIGDKKDAAVDDKTAELSAAARPALEKVLGDDALAPDGFPKELLDLAVDTLVANGSGADAAPLRTLLAGGEVKDESTVESALDLAFGAGFMKDRAPSLPLIDAVLDSSAAQKLNINDVAALRSLRAQLDYASEVELFGEDGVSKPMSTDTADQALRDLFGKLKKGTGLKDAAVFQVASRLMAALHMPSTKPQVIILAGAKGTGVDTLFNRAKEVAGDDGKSAAKEVQGATDLRIADPVGFLIGAPNGENNLARGALVPKNAKDKSDRFVASIDGVEAIGAGVVGEKKDAAQRSFWSFVQQTQRDGWFRGYTGEDDLGSAKVDVAGGVILLRTSESLDELRKSMPDAAWSQLAPQVIDFGKTDGESVVAELGAVIESRLTELYGFKDPHVTLAAGAQSFIQSLVDRGADAAQIQQMVLSEVLPRIYYAAVDDNLSPSLKIELVRGLTPKEQERLRAQWLDGKHVGFAGGGGAAFTIHDEGMFESKGRATITAKLERRLSRDREIEKLRHTILGYQGQAASDEKTISALIDENLGRSRRIGELDEHVTQLTVAARQQRAQIEDLRTLNRQANDTIVELKAQIEELNGRIDLLNRDLKKTKDAAASLKEKLAQAVKERDDVTSTLRSVETEFNGAIQQFATSFAQTDPRMVFAMIEQAAKTATGRYARGLLDQLHQVATAASLERANALQAEMGKWAEIAVMASQYVAASRALGRSADGRVLGMLENAARLSGNNGAPANRFQMSGWNDVRGSMQAVNSVQVSQWENQLAKEWERVVGLPSGFQGQDPGIVGNALKNMASYLGVRV